MAHVAGWCRAGRVLLGMLALACVVPTHAAAQSIARQGDHFRVGTQDKFLIFLSYFDAMNASDIDADFAYIATLNVDGVRIMPNWWDTSCGSPYCYASNTLMTPAGLSSSRLARLQTVLTFARNRGLLVDLTFTRETVCASSNVQTCPNGQTLTEPAYRDQIKQVLEALNSASYNHVIVDLQNEFDNEDPDTTNTDETQELTQPQVGGIVTAIRPTIGARLLMASATEATPAGNIGTFVAGRGLDIAAYHDPHNDAGNHAGNWPAATSAFVTTLRDSFTLNGLEIRPVYLQEPTRWDQEPSSNRAAVFAMAVKNARSSGAAAWTFHTNAGFHMTGGGLFSTHLGTGEASAIQGLRAQADTMCTAALTSLTWPAFAGGGTVDIPVKMPIGCVLSAGATDAGIPGATVSIVGDGSYASIVRVVAPANTTPFLRTLHLSIDGQAVSVPQPGTGCTYTLGTTSVLWPSVRTATLGVTAPAGCQWTANATSTGSWLTIIGGASGSGNGTITVRSTANRLGTSRTAQVSLNPQVSVTVTQAPKGVTNDVDGDRLGDPTVFDPVTRVWRTLMTASGGSELSLGPFGLTSDQPFAFDQDGDGRADFAVWRRATAQWYVRYRIDGSVSSAMTVGSAGDLPVVEDFDGDGRADVGAFNPITRVWNMLLSAGGSALLGPFGLTGDMPFALDHDGDGHADLVVWRPSTAQWFVQRWSDGVVSSPIPLGAVGDVPITGDFDGDGRGDFAAFRPSTRVWFLHFATGAETAVGPFGLSGDVPMALDFDSDGHAELALYRAATRQWFGMRWSDGALFGPFLAGPTGLVSDLPVGGGQRSARADFDGNGRTDATVFDSTTRVWSIRFSGPGSGTAWGPFGLTGDVPFALDYDGDRLTDMAVWRPATAQWYVQRSRDGAVLGPFQVGQAGDLPVSGDIDGDGRIDVGVFQPATAVWRFRLSTTGLELQLGPFGLTNDVPFVFDYDGDGHGDLAVWRPSTAQWYIRRWRDGAVLGPIQIGQVGDLPVVGDLDGDGRADVGVFQPSTGVWRLWFSTTGSEVPLGPFGLSGDVPLAFDYDGDGRAEMVVWRPSTRQWFVMTWTGYDYGSFVVGLSGVPVRQSF